MKLKKKMMKKYNNIYLAINLLFLIPIKEYKSKNLFSNSINLKIIIFNPIMTILVLILKKWLTLWKIILS
jgi:hypothetical protein